MRARIAWILQEVAASRSGRPVSDLRADPVGWAYVLRDAIALAEPDVVVSHLEPSLEAEALAGLAAAGDGDWVDRLMDAAALAQAEPVAAAMRLVGTLAALPDLHGRVATTVTGPASVAARLGPVLAGYGYAAEDDAEELADLVADLLGALVAAYAQAGAAAVILVEDDGGHALLDEAARERSVGPLRRAAEHARVELHRPGDEGLVLVPARVWAEAEDDFTAAIGRAAARGGLLLSHGPVPGTVDVARLRQARVLIG